MIIEMIGRKSEIQNQYQKLSPICLAKMAAANWKQLIMEKIVRTKPICKSIMIFNFDGEDFLVKKDGFWVLVF
jgi:hypothetical protein